MAKIVGFLGKKGSGKDTSGTYLIENYGYIRYAFGDPVKEVCRHMFNLKEDQLTGINKEIVDPRWNMKPREMFQYIGTEFGQFEIHKIIPKINEQVKFRSLWCKLFEQWLEEHKKDKIVITDVRFNHEIDCILKHGGEIFKIENPNNESNDNHLSEIEMNININSSSNSSSNSINNNNIKTIMNDTELVDLYSQLDLFGIVPF